MTSGRGRPFAGMPGFPVRRGTGHRGTCRCLRVLFRWRSSLLISPAETTGAELPEAGADRNAVVAGGDQEALRIGADRQLRQRPGRGPKGHLSALGGVERGLVARAEDMVGRLLVQRRRAPYVRAYLGIGDDVVHGPIQDRARAAGPVRD